ncbi:amino acid ABC transporter permease [Acinetobacter wuhouensis]|uniref:Glutamate/aspartate import permease protein GltK n=1 Tax=Acinetobacter wuhouensis TaxID=1879050 RepID=A0A385C2G1_9GAMM|nr:MULTISPECIES: amino acid ABC transporter permease [Acinetobacter]AXQ21406.1 amino acid ABC transporter permease [Acinetobacter wuhouensis]AYO55356.1 amino acid ABC transporter permease [Acinetobacter wuhouensis]RZG44285.1 amino acid ABC transporter permease [Acinetobacter wuhouensis]RZG72059.1 amino acid ABC transporter permease [Acinetobacter wuhouensis]RZG75362.1 amino acid ABC transporter permease [Acinetobacter sp. WCHAc060025]
MEFSLLQDPNVTQALLSGLKFTAIATILSIIGGILIGTPLAMMRLSNNVVASNFAKIYVDFFRGVPLIQVIFIFYFLLPKYFEFQSDTYWGPLFSTVVTFAIFEAAFFSEIVRSGIQSVSKGQVNAGYALGFTYGQTMSNVVLPQAFRNMLPVLLTQSIVLFQDISLVYVISAPDFLGQANTLANNYGAETKAMFYLIVAIVYFCISFALSRLVKRLHQKIAIIR